MRVLLVDDEPKMVALLQRGIGEEGIASDVARAGEEALWMVGATRYDAVVMDVMLPGIDGIETCRRMRAAGVWTPILMLTARDGVDDRVAGLDAGADDYMLKPFAFTELLARLRAVARRAPSARPAILEVGDLSLDPAARTVARAGTPIGLSPREFAVLETFMRRPGRVLSRLQLLENVWEEVGGERSNIVEVYVRYLREKVDRPFGVSSIETVRGVGYLIRPDGGRRAGEPEGVTRRP